jgi:hypothetical protein
LVKVSALQHLYVSRERPEAMLHHQNQLYLARTESCWWGGDMLKPPAEGPGGSVLEGKAVSLEGDPWSVEGQAGRSSAGVWRRQVGPGLLLRPCYCLCSAVLRGLAGWPGRPGSVVYGVLRLARRPNIIWDTTWRF